MDEDDDAFLYGAGDEAAAAVQPAQLAPGLAANGISGDTNQAGPLKQAAASEEEVEEEGEEDEDDDDDDSDSDLEIIVEGSAGPPAGYNVRPGAAPIRPVPIAKPAPSTITSDYVPNARPGQTNAANSLAAIAEINAEPSKVASTSHLDDTLLPEGPPPNAPITAPRIVLDPSEQSLHIAPETVESEPGPLIYHVDPTEFDEKPWRRPGADLTDWFNYGFDENSWKLWGEKKTSRTNVRRDMEKNGGADGREENGEEPYNDHNSTSDFASQNMPPQQMQAMQAMMGASGLNMPPEQMMAFMGMGPSGFPGMGSMMGMPGMGGMFGQQNSNQGMFGNGFGQGMPNMQMMQQGFQGVTPTDSSLMRFVDPSHGASTGSMSQATNHGADGNVMKDDANAETKEEAIERPYSPKEPDDIKDEVKIEEPRGGGADLSRRSEHGSSQGKAAAPNNQSLKGVPTGPSRDRNASNLPSNVPTGPKNPGRRYNDRDNGLGVADSLDYGAGQHNRVESGGRSPAYRSRRSPSASRQRQYSVDSREPSTEREVRNRDRDRDYDRDNKDGYRSSRRTRATGDDRRRHDSSDDDQERQRRKDSQRYNSTRRGGERRSQANSEDEWEKESVASTSSRRRPASTRYAAEDTGSRRISSSRRGERRREADADSGEETEKERKTDRSQLRSERRAGREDDLKGGSSRKRHAPDDEPASPARGGTSSSRKRR